MARKAMGFAEDQQAAFAHATQLADGSTGGTEARLKIGPGGRVVIPAEMRAVLGVEEGDTLLGSVVDGELRLLSTATAIKRAQAIVRTYIPAGTSLVDELIADRRAEAAAEEAEAKLGRRL